MRCIEAAITTSQRDLTGRAVTGHIGSIRLAGVGAIAVYAGIDSGSDCQTIAENMPTLLTSNIRGDFILSFWLCTLRCNVRSDPPVITPNISGTAGNDGW